MLCPLSIVALLCIAALLREGNIFAVFPDDSDIGCRSVIDEQVVVFLYFIEVIKTAVSIGMAICVSVFFCGMTWKF